MGHNVVMKIELSKKLKGKQREAIRHALRIASHDHPAINDLKLLKIGALNKRDAELFGGFAYYKNNKGYIKLDRRDDVLTTIETFSHEITHIAQYARGDLRDTKYFTIWKECVKIPHFLIAFIPFGDVKYNPIYWYSAWEVEARKYSAKLLKEIENRDYNCGYRNLLAEGRRVRYWLCNSQ